VLSKVLAVTTGAATAFCAFVAPAARVDAAPASACTARSGVTVIVDFTSFGGDIERGCDSGQPGTALDALNAAGFSTAGTTRYGDAFVCRIDGRPGSEHEACVDTPPASSSWSFYFARPSDRAWTYSAAGVLTYRPPSGSLLAFAFGDYAKPGVLPSGATATTTSTTTAAPPTPSTQPPVTALAGPIATAPPPVVTPPAATAVTTAPPSTTTTAPRTAPPTTTTRAATTTAGPRIVDKTASGPVSSGGDSGSPLPAVITVALLAALGGGAFALIRSRRRSAT
jgi:MYXO-CTERM domain-containing protein